MDRFSGRKNSTDVSSNMPFITFEHTVAQREGLFNHRKMLKDQELNRDNDTFEPTLSFTNTFAKDDSGPTFEPLSPALTIGENSGDEQPSTPGRIARPKNAFMLYRSNFLASDKINRSVEHDNRHISRIIGHCWQKLSKEEKLIWHQRAEVEKIEHAKKHPGYKFSPVPRAKKPLKRKGKRNGEKEMERCRQVADLLLSGKEGDELAAAIKQLDLENAEDGKQDGPEILETSYAYYPPEESRAPVFVNPLRPPPARNAHLQPPNVSSPTRRAPTNYQGHRQQYYPSPPESPASPNIMYSENSDQNSFLLRPATFYRPHSSYITTNMRSRIEPYAPGPSHGHMNNSQTMNYQILPGQSDHHLRGSQQSADFFMDHPGQTYTFLSPSLPPTLGSSRYTPGNNFYGDLGL